MLVVRCRASAAALVSLALLSIAPALASAPPDPQAVPREPSSALRVLIGEYRSVSQTLTLYEKGGRLFLLVAGAPGPGAALRAHGSAPYVTDEGRPLRVRRATAPATIEWDGLNFEQFDLGAERVATIRARVHADAQSLRDAALAASPPKEPVARRFELVPLVGVVPHVKLDIKYATSDNFIGLPLYQTAAAYLQRPAAAALAAVAQSLANQGLGLVIFDAYRPWFVTKMFWEAVPPDAQVFVADPNEGSKHNRGCAVDLSLYDLRTGRPIEMTGRYDEMSPRSFADYPGGTERERWFRNLLREEMEARGFEVYAQEWWHFDYKDWQQYPIGNQAFESLRIATRE